MPMTRPAPSIKALLIANCPTGPQPPHGHGIAGLYVAVLRRHVPRGENIGKEENLLVGQAIRHFDRPNIGKRHPNVLRLSPRIATGEM